MTVLEFLFSTTIINYKQTDCILSINRKGVVLIRTKLNITEGIFPMPVLMVATYNEDGSVNVMNAAWGTMQERGTVALNLTETHKTVQNGKLNMSLVNAIFA